MKMLISANFDLNQGYNELDQNLEPLLTVEENKKKE